MKQLAGKKHPQNKAVEKEMQDQTNKENKWGAATYSVTGAACTAFTKSHTLHTHS